MYRINPENTDLSDDYNLFANEYILKKKIGYGSFG